MTSFSSVLGVIVSTVLLLNVFGSTPFLSGIISPSLAFAQSGDIQGGSIDPLVVEETLAPGSSVQVNKQVTVPKLPSNLDLLLLEDETSSFNDDIATIKGSAPDCSDGLASEIFDTLSEDVSGFRAGVAGFRDFAQNGWGQAGDHVYRLLQDLTDDKSAWLSGICDLGVGTGGDSLEAQLAALKTAADGSAWDSNGDGDSVDPNDTPAGQNPSWRSESVRIVVLVTDAEFHVQGDSGGWPGPTLAETLQALDDEEILPFFLVTAEVQGTYRNLADQTGGAVELVSSDSSDVVEAILSALGQLTVDVWHESSCDAGIDVSLEPEARLDLQVASVTNFSESISVAPETADGQYMCTVMFLAGEFPNGVPMGQQEVVITVLTPNQPPNADAGSDRTVNEGITFLLDGRGSFDLDGDALSFSWIQTAGPVVLVSNANKATPSIVAPQVDSTTLFTFQLTVSDGVAQDIDTVDITVLDVTKVLVPLSQNVSDGLIIANASVDIGDIPSDQSVELDFTNDQLGNVRFDSVSFALASASSNTTFGLTASNQVLGFDPPVSADVVLFLDFEPDASLDLAVSASFSRLPTIVFEVPKTDGSCITALFFLDETLTPPEWTLIDSPVFLAETETSCTMQATTPHFSKFSVGGVKRATGGGGINWDVLDTMAPSILDSYWKPDTPFAGEEVLINTKIIDDVGIEKATLYYQTAKDEYSKKYSVAMSKLNSEWYIGKIPNGHVVTPSFKYWATATDFGGNTVESKPKEVDVKQGTSIGARASTTNLPVHVLEAIKPKMVEPMEKLEVISVSHGNEISTYPDEIVIKNIGQKKAENIRVMLSPEISKSFKLSHTAIKSIEPNSSVSVRLELNGNPSKDMFGSLVGYNGQIIVVAEHSSPLTLPVSIGATKSYFVSSYLERIADKASLRYNKLSSLNDLLSWNSEVEKDFEVTTTSGERELTSVADELVIKNVSDRPLKNLRIKASSLGSMILLDQSNIKTLAPNESVTVEILPRIDSAKYSPRDFTGEIIVAADNGLPQVIPIRIAAVEQEDSKNDFDVTAVSNIDAVTSIVDRITITNDGDRPMDSVKLMLSSNLDRVLQLSENTFKTIASGEAVDVYLSFRAELGDKKEMFMRNYDGELTVISEHHNQKKIPIKLEWNRVESDHFITYARNSDEKIANEMVEVLEDNFVKVTSRFGEPYSKTSIFIASNSEEMSLVAHSANSYYSYADDTVFVCACEEPAYNAMKEFIYRTIVQTSVTYYNMKALTFHDENWLLDGIAEYAASEIMGQDAADRIAEDGLVSFEWHGSGSDMQHVGTYGFLDYLEAEYGRDVTGKLVESLSYSITTNHKCSSVEECSILNAVYEVNGWDLDKRRYTLSFNDIVAGWKESLQNSK